MCSSMLALQLCPWAATELSLRNVADQLILSCCDREENSILSISVHPYEVVPERQFEVVVDAVESGTSDYTDAEEFDKVGFVAERTMMDTQRRNWPDGLGKVDLKSSSVIEARSLQF